MTAGFLAMPAIEQAFTNEIPLGRLPSTDDMANAALWLLSDESFMTGRTLDISGGQTLRRIPTATEMGF
jgi:NAD(P)-dependent dehydrogenase (short-subunit alcohol dehydrogenase family)